MGGLRGALIAGVTLVSVGSAGAGPIDGRVFVDGNRDGALSAGEETVPGAVVVRDLDHVAITDGDGYFTIEGPEEAGIVWVRVPVGFRPGPVWAAVPAEGGTFDLPLVAQQAEPDAPFAVASDLHVGKEELGRDGVLDDDDMLHSLSQVSAALPRPRFVALTGDLVQANRPEHYAILRDAAASLDIPVVPVPGNHDWYDRGASYRSILGPDMYSFDQEDAHYVVLNDNAGVATWTSFLQWDLEAVPETRPVVAFIHRPPEDPELAALEASGVDYLFTGHWHSNMLFEFGALMQLNTEPFIRGGIDGTPAGFRLVRLVDGMLAGGHRTVVSHEVIRIVSPAMNQCVAPGEIDVLAAVELGEQVAEVVATAAGVTIRLEPAGAWTWKGTLKVGGATARYLEVRAMTREGQVVSTMQPIFPCGCSPQLEADDWRQVQGTARHGGTSPRPIEPPVSTLWTAALGGHPGGPAVVAGDIVLVSIADLDLGAEGGVVALDLSTGRERWRFQPGRDVRAPVAVEDGVVLVPASDGLLHGLDLPTGDLLWSADLGAGTPTITRILHAPPVVDAGVAYIGVHRNWAAVDVRSGEILWAHDPAPGNTTLTSRSAAALVDDLVIGSVARGRNGLFAWERSTGEERWRLAVNDSIGIHASPVSDGDAIYVVNGEARVIALDAASGDTRWRTQVVSGAGNWDYSVLSTPALADGRLFVPTLYDDLVALDVRDGQEIWRHAAGPGALQDAHARTRSSSFPSSPVVTGGVLWVVGGDGLLRALDPVTGSVRWSFDLGVPGTGGITPAGGYLLITTFDGTIRAMYSGDCAVRLADDNAIRPADDGGCGCQAGGRGSMASLLLVLAALVRLSRRDRAD